MGNGKFDLDFFRIMVLKVGVLVTQESNELLDHCHKATLPDIISWNVIKLVYKVFERKDELHVFFITLTVQQVC